MQITEQDKNKMESSILEYFKYHNHETNEKKKRNSIFIHIRTFKIPKTVDTRYRQAFTNPASCISDLHSFAVVCFIPGHANLEFGILLSCEGIERI